MAGVGVNNTDFSNAWWTGGNATATGSTTGSFWNEISGATQKMQFEREEAEKARLFNSAEAEKARLFNSAEAQRDRDWQTEMSNTAYQRAASDMKAAGINPASLGGNASMSPASSGSAHTVHADAASGPAADAPGGASSGGIFGLVLQGIGMALKANVARSALAVDRDGLDLGKFKAESQKALNAAKIADLEVNTALKERTKRLQTNHDLKVAAEQAKARRIDRERAKRAAELSDDELDRMIDGLYGRNG